ncbi:hypothetical protein WMF31_08695 [Sorangium sp. So ce1036]|uniref:hypothetical protein n=1 Tax=Sorangium sp. So ce1036 TaxID=3133328 RepID=UPI003F0ECB5B
MAARSVVCTLINKTGELLSLADTQLDHGIFTPGKTPPATCNGAASWSGESDGLMTGTEGRVTYKGPSGAVTLHWNNPFVGDNDHGATPAGDYVIEAFQGPEAGSNVSATCVVGRKCRPDLTGPKATDEPAQAPPAPPARPAAAAPEAPGKDSHVPKLGGQLTVITRKDWLVDIAWQAVNCIEWSPLILEITENRHGSQSGAECPGALPTFPGVKEGGTCRRSHAALARTRIEREASCDAETKRLKAAGMEPSAAEQEARKKHPLLYNDFYSWCGDLVTWVFWKAWVLRGSPEDKITKTELGKFLNREALNGAWQPGKNLSMVEAYAKEASTGLLVWHPPGDGYLPSPGDIFMANRAAGGHIAIVADHEREPPGGGERGADLFTTIDGKSFDLDRERGWLPSLEKLRKEGHAIELPAGKWQGVAQTRRRSNDKKDPLRGFIDTSKLREVLGYR